MRTIAGELCEVKLINIVEHEVVLFMYSFGRLGIASWTSLFAPLISRLMTARKSPCVEPFIKVHPKSYFNRRQRTRFYIEKRPDKADKFKHATRESHTCRKWNRSPAQEFRRTLSRNNGFLHWHLSPVSPVQIARSVRYGMRNLNSRSDDTKLNPSGRGRSWMHRVKCRFGLHCRLNIDSIDSVVVAFYGAFARIVIQLLCLQQYSINSLHSSRISVFHR